jgi:TonB family protein
MVPPALALAGKTLTQIQVFGLSDDARTRLMSRVPVRVGDVLASDSYERTFTAIREYDEHMTLSTRIDKDQGASFLISAPGASLERSTAPMPEMAPPANGVRRILIGGEVQQAKLTSKATPVYPPLAKQARISGTVSLAAVIGVDGSMRDLKVISGHPLLIPAAMDAVRLWTYNTTLLNGEPVEVSTRIDVNFTLSDDPPQQ